MRLRHHSGRVVHLSHAMNVRPARDLPAVVEQLDTCAAVRTRLGVDTLGVSLWLPPTLAAALAIDGRSRTRLRAELDALPVAKAKSGKTRPVLDKADQTPVTRDFAFVVEEKVPAGDITRLALKADPKLITAARVFDVYRGASIGEGKKSVAVEVTLQPRGAALTDEQIEAVSSSIVKSVAKGTGATLRG